MDKKTLVIFDNDSTETKQVFDNYWEIEKRVVTQTATEENLISAERTDTGHGWCILAIKREYNNT